MTCLLIDDNPIDLLVHQRVLENILPEISVQTMRTAVEAAEYLTGVDTLPELVFLDIRMPLMNGFEFLNQCRANPRLAESTMRIFVVSSSIDPKDVSRALKDPLVEGFLEKPLKQEIVREKIATIQH